MYRPLVPCPGCERHVRYQETHCPFCDELLDPVEAETRIAPDTNQRLGRAAAFVFGATVALAACSGEAVVGEDDGAATSTSSSSATSGQGGFANMYGVPPVGGMGGEEAGAGGMGDAPLYGGPPTSTGTGGAGGADGGTGGGSSAEGGGTAQPLYGSPAPGFDSSGN